MPLFNWKNISVTESATIRETLKVLDQQSMQIVLIVDDNQHLIGTLTDGDVRRALLDGHNLDSLVSVAMNSRPSYGYETENEVAWRKKMQARDLRHLPILTAQGILMGLFHLKQKITTSRTTPVVMMLGGLGMRLRPLTESVPKPMLKVGNKPILETIISHIAEQGFTEFYFCINYLGEQIREYFGDGERWGIRIHYVEEKTRLGTAGALGLLPERPTESFIVMNGDLLTKVNLPALINFHQEHQNIATACVREYSQQVPYGVIELNNERISQIVEKPVYRYFVNAGIYCLSPVALDKIPSESFYDMPTLMDDLLADQLPVGGFPLTDYWMDIGKMPDFEQAQADYDVHFKSPSGA